MAYLPDVELDKVLSATSFLLEQRTRERSDWYIHCQWWQYFSKMFLIVFASANASGLWIQFLLSGVKLVNKYENHKIKIKKYIKGQPCVAFHHPLSGFVLIFLFFSRRIHSGFLYNHTQPTLLLSNLGRPSTLTLAKLIRDPCYWNRTTQLESPAHRGNHIYWSTFTSID